MLSLHELEASDVVANSQMNRERQLSGPNSYALDLRFNPLDAMRSYAEAGKSVRWLDLCCGTGKAIMDAAKIVRQEGLSIEIVGVDLVPMFDPAGTDLPSLTLVAASLHHWEPDDPFDLITCVHGLHYVGDKLGLLQRAVRWLKPGGRFVGHLDMNNVQCINHQSIGREVAAVIRQTGGSYASKSRLLEVAASPLLCFPFAYLGANDHAGPNYTGQPAVDSVYKRIS